MDITKALVYALVEVAVENKNLQAELEQLNEKYGTLLGDNFDLSVEHNALKKELEAAKCQK